MGRGEAVTQRTLDPLFGGSNPPAPATNSYLVARRSYLVIFSPMGREKKYHVLFQVRGRVNRAVR